MKNPKAPTSKKSVQASRTMTRQSAMKDISRGPDSLNLSNSELDAHEIANLKRKFSDGEVFELPDSELPTPTVVLDEDVTAPEGRQQAAPSDTCLERFTTSANSPNTSQSVSGDDSPGSEANKQYQSTKDKSQTRLPLPPKPFTIISGFRK
jgi:hypothetical protein